MKSLILLFIFWNFGLSNETQPYDSIGFDCCPVLFATDEVEISYDPKYYSLFFDPIQYDESNDKIHIKSKIEIDYLNVFSENNQKLHLKIEAKSLILDQNIFSRKHTKIVFHFKEDHRLFEMFWNFK